MGILNSKTGKRPSPAQSKTSQIDHENASPKGFACKNMLVLQRTGSQFFDKDGDMAHEFYEEVRLSDGHTTMQKITTDLRPQGVVTLHHPRLHPDYPYVLV